MKHNFHVVGLALQMYGMKDGAADPINLQNWWKVAQTKLNDFARNRRPSTINSPALVAFLLSERNRNAAQFNLNDVKMSFERRADGKKGYVASVRWMPPLQMDTIAGGSGDYCPQSGETLGYEMFPYQIDRLTRTKAVEVDDGFVRCLQEGKDEYVAEVLFNLSRAAVSAWARDVSVEAYNLQNNYIGDFPDRFEGTVSTAPGKVLNLFRNTTNAYNEVNWVAESELEMDMGQAQVDEYVKFGGTIAKHYAKLKQISVPNTDAGIDPSMLMAFEESNFFFDSYIEKATGVQHPLFVMRPGALQIITYSKNQGDFVHNDEQHQRVSIVDPILGQTWDLIINKIYCGDDVKWTAFLELRWGLIGYPDCAYEDDPLRVGVKDTFLYSIGCGDTPVCNLPSDKQAATTNSEPYDNDCTIDEVCDPTCSVSLTGQLLANGDYQVIAFPTPSLGANVESGGYDWEVNGASQATPATPYIFTLSAGAYANGDVVTLTVTDTATCEATANLVVEVPEIDVDADSQNTTDGGTLDLGSGAQGTAKVVTVDITNGGSLDPLTITGIAESGDILAGSYVAPTLPTNAPLSFDFTFDNGSTGVKTVQFDITTNDPNTATYVLIVQYEYT